MKLSLSVFRAPRAVSFLLGLAVLLPVARATNTVGNVYSGQAAAVHIVGVVNPPGLNPIAIAETGELGVNGGAKPALQHNVNLAGGGLTAAQAGSLAAGGFNQSLSVSSLTNFHAEFVTEHGDHLTIEADSICAAASAGGSSAGRLNADVKVQIRGLRINGVAVAVTGQPNQVILVGESRIILNEQTVVEERTNADAAVTAIHFYTCQCIEGWLARVDAGFTLTEKPTQDCYERACRERADRCSHHH